jgi:hypothetical protein
MQRDVERISDIAAIHVTNDIKMLLHRLRVASDLFAACYLQSRLACFGTALPHGACSPWPALVTLPRRDRGAADLVALDRLDLLCVVAGPRVCRAGHLHPGRRSH